MKILYSWIPDTKKTVLVLSCVLVFIYLCAVTLHFFGFKFGIFISTVVMAMTVLIPFGMLVALITSTQAFKIIIETPWSKSIISVCLIAYMAMSNAWSSDVINKIYGVSASNFIITQTFLTVIFFVINIMKPLFWFFAYGGIVLTILSTAIFIIIFLLKRRLIVLVYFFGWIIITVATYSMTVNIDSCIELFAKRVAAWGDFYKSNRCKEKQDYGPNGGVIFVSPGKVLILKERVGEDGKEEQYYPIESCTM